jgi:hypothetical protein
MKLSHPDVQGMKRQDTHSFVTLTSRRRFSHSSFPIEVFGGFMPPYSSAITTDLKRENKSTNHGGKKKGPTWITDEVGV